MDYQAIVEERLRRTHQQLVHLHPAPHDYLLKLQEKVSLVSFSRTERDKIGRILLTYEIHSFLRASLTFFEWDLNVVPLSERVDMGNFFRKRLAHLPPEQLDVANWILEKVIPYCDQCQEQAGFHSFESFLDLLHIIDQLSFITEQINDDKEARITWMFDWFHTFKSDVAHYKFLERDNTYANFDIQVLSNQLFKHKTKCSRVGSIRVSNQNRLTTSQIIRGERVYGQERERIKMEYQKRPTPNYSIQMSQ